MSILLSIYIGRRVTNVEWWYDGMLGNVDGWLLMYYYGSIYIYVQVGSYRFRKGMLVKSTCSYICV